MANTTKVANINQYALLHKEQEWEEEEEEEIA